MSLKLRRAARLWNIQTGYSDFDQKPVKTADATLKKLVASLSGLQVETEEGLDEAIRLAHKRRVDTILEPTLVAFAGTSIEFNITLPKAWWVAKLETEIQSTEETKAGSAVGGPKKRFKVDANKSRAREISFNGKSYERRTVEVPCDLETGYFKLVLFRDGQKIAESHLLSRPPKEAQSHPKIWGAFAPLYALKSKRNFGIGDFTDMRNAQDWLHQLGASFFGTLPLFSALNEGEGADPSPYSPVSRLFWNEIYLDVEFLARDSAKALERIKSPEFQKQLEQLRSNEIVNHERVFALKKEILEILSHEFFEQGGDRSEEFLAFLKQEPLVLAYSKFRADKAEASSSARERYHLYVQYQCHRTLTSLASAAKAKKTAGLYLDFPVGVSRSGFDANFFRSTFLEAASAGAPPDLLFHGGQDWGFAPFHPQGVRESGYDYFKHCLRINLQFASVLRLDHIMAFFRIYAVPQGLKPTEGGYLRYKSEEFFAVLAIEGERSQARVVGEDLGTVPDEVRRLILENDCLRMWVLPFEAGTSPSRAIAKIPSQTLACLNTHDLIPLAGYMTGHDSELFHELGLLGKSEMTSQIAERTKTIEAWRKDLKATSSQSVLKESLKLMARSNAEMVLVNLEDLWNETEPQNVPGTWRERPNWQRKLKFDLATIESSAQIREPLEALAHAREMGKQ